MTEHLNHFIAGASLEASDGRRIDLIDPVTEQVYARSARGTADDVNRAVGAALEQLERGAWSQLDGAQRGRLLSKLADLVERDSERLALGNKWVWVLIVSLIAYPVLVFW